jgi:hypothetical protein
VRLIDSMFRQGHLSDRAINEAVITGERPAHLDQCDLCAERAREASLWLDDIREAAVGEADRIFTAERLNAQQAHVMRRLEQADEPSRVIAFPHASRGARDPQSRRVAPAWVGVAAAAGLILGVVGGQLSARLEFASQARALPTESSTDARLAATDPSDQLSRVDTSNALFLQLDLDNAATPSVLEPINGATPSMTQLFAGR